MSFIPQWRESLKTSALLFAPLLKDDPSLNLLYGLCAGALLWVVRDLPINPDMQQAVREAGTESSLPFLQMIVAGWADATPLAAARNLGSMVKGSPDLKAGVDALLVYFMNDLMAVELIQPPKSRDISIQGNISGANVLIGSTQVIAGDLVIHYITQPKIRACPTAPKPPAHFAGRREELDHLKTLLRQGETVAITAVHGTGGIGKTALALKLASELTDYSAVLWGSIGQEPVPVNTLITWAKHADPDFAPHEDERLDPDKLALRVQALLTNLINEQCPGPVLMILDDVWEQDSLRAARLLQKAVPVNSVTLITTRSQQVSAQLRSVRVDLYPMTPADALQMLRNLLRAYPEIPNDTLLDLAKVVGYHPLAMELAAGQVSLLERPVLDIDDLIERYRGGIPNGSPFRDIQLELGEDREDNLGLALSFSYDELKPTEDRSEDLRPYFRALGTLAYDVPFSRVMCEAIWHAEASGKLDLLRHRALLTIDDEPGWYRQHPLLRAYARAVLNAAHETDVVFDRYVGEIIQVCEQFYSLPLDQWDSTLGFQYPHILHVGDEIVKQTQTGTTGDIERAHTFAVKTRLYLGYRREIQRMTWLETGLQTARRLQARVQEKDILSYQEREAVFLNDIGVKLDALGEKHQALKFYEQSLSLSQALRDQSGEAFTLNNIGKVWSDLGEKHQALVLYQQALQLLITLQNLHGEAGTLNNIGEVWDELGQKRRALVCYEEALLLYQVVGDQGGQATALNNIGMAYYDLREMHKALAYYEQALALFTATGDRRAEAVTLNNMRIAWFELKEMDKALAYHKKALPLRRDVGDRSGEAATLNNMASIYNALGKHREAIETFGQALDLRQVVGDRFGEVITRWWLSILYNQVGERSRAKAMIEEAIRIAETVESPYLTAVREQLEKL